MDGTSITVSIGKDQLIELVCKQLKHNFLLDKDEKSDVLTAISRSLLRTQVCFNQNMNKYYWDDKKTLIFNPYHSGQYSIFLYFLSQEVWVNENRLLADKIYSLNKMLNCCNLYYEVELPDIFFLDHPIGSVIGRASYGNYFVCQQNCTVGVNHGIYPRFGNFVWLFASTTVVGDTKIGSNVFVSTGTLIKDEEVPDNTIVFGKSPHLILKHKPPEYFYRSSPFKVHKDMMDEQDPHSRTVA